MTTHTQRTPSNNPSSRGLFSRLALPVSICLALLTGALNSRAASDIWDGSLDGAWANSANWLTDPVIVPGTGDTATFNGAGNGNTTIDLGAGVTVSNIVFDTASAAGYTIGSGGAGSQSLTLDTIGGILLTPTVVNSQVINANLNLPAVAAPAVTLSNSSAALLTVAGGVVGNGISGNGVLTVSGSGNTLLSGGVTRPGAGSLALFKRGPGQLTISSNAVWNGAGAASIGFSGPFTVQEGTLRLTDNTTNAVTGELVIGGVAAAHGGAGQNARIIVADNARLTISSWLSVGRGNGTGGVTSELILSNNAVVTTANMSAGFNGGNAANMPKGSINLYNNSALNITAGGDNVHIGESSGSDITVNINDTATLTTAGTIVNVGRNNGTAAINVNGGAVNFGGVVRIGRGQDLNSSAKGTVTVNNGTVRFENDPVLGYAGSAANGNLGKLVINGGTVNVASTVVRWLIMNQFDTSPGQLDVNNGQLNINAGSSIRTSTGNGASQGTNSINLNGGAITFYSDNATTIGGLGELDLQRSGGANSRATFNLNGGTITVPRVMSTAASGTRIFNFNGGTLRAAPTPGTANFMDFGFAGVPVVNVRDGGAVIDSNGRDIAIMHPLQHSDVPGDSAIDGGLTKNGAGTLTLAGGYTYTGPTVINGGGLSVDASLVGTTSALSVGAAALTVSAPAGFFSLPVTSLTLNNGSVLNLNYGSLTANPTAPAINSSGALASLGATVININAFGLEVGQFPLIDYTGTPLANLANFSLGPLPPGVVATLVNNTANTSIDLNITSTGQNLTWSGLNALTGLPDTTWDIGITTNWMETGGSTPLPYQEYTTTSTVGDPVRFDDFVYNDFVNPQPTNINLTTALSPFAVTVDSTLPYQLSGPGSLTGMGSLVKSNSGSLTLSTANTHTGGTFIFGGSVVIDNDNALGAANSAVTLGGGSLQVTANTTNATRPVNVTAASSIGVAPGANLQLGGVISGGGGLSKIDTGTLTVAGSNGLTGNLSVDQGTLRSTGTQLLPAVARVGNTPGLDGALNVAGGSFRADNNAGQFTSSLIVGAAAGSAGSILLSGGTLTVRQQLGLGAGAGGYGALNMTGGTLASGSYIVVGFNNDRAVYNQSGGTVTISSNLMTIAAGGVGSIAVANISGGTFTANFGASSGIMVGERGIGTLNVSGSAVINVPTNAGLTVGPVAAQTGWDGTLNLNGGTITANRVVKGPGTGVARVNFNGGTLKATTANATFLSGMDNATVYANGVTFDDSGTTISVPQALLAPTDYGVSSISLASGGSGYLDAPIVTIVGGSGSNATAIATVSGGVVTGVIVTCPGTGYSSSDALIVNFESGGTAVTPAVANLPVLTPNVSGGLVKRGTGTLNLTGANTFSGSNFVAAGTMLITPSHQSSGQVVVASNAAFGILANSVGAATVGNLTFGSTAQDRTTLAFALATGSNPTTPVMECGTLTLNGTNTVRLSGTVAAGTFPLLQYSGAIAGSGVFDPAVIAPQGQVATLSNHVAGSTLYVTVVGSPGIVWTGTNSAPSLTNVWNLNSATNWVAAGVPTSYQESIPPGDPVTFNDSGSGVVLLSNVASPASVTISNDTVNYTFSGTGRISGTTGITKQGNATVTMSLAGNDFSGGLDIEGGTFRLGSGTAIGQGPSSGGVTISPNTTLDMAGFSETINGLSGSGVIDNTGGGASTLTIGSGDGGGVWSGTTTNTGGTVTLIKVGSGSLTISGTNYLGGTSQFNGGTNYLLSTGRIESIGAGEFWVQQNAGNSTFIVDGGSLTVNNWLVIGRNAAAANGTLIINGGTVQKAGPNNVVVGSLGASGTLIINGGQLLNNGNLWLGENATANATLRLNGGLIQATQVRPQNAVASSTAYFNGGVLQATGGSADFLSSSTTALIQSGGLILDSQGFDVAIGQALQSDPTSLGGPLIKTGTGTLVLAAANFHDGTTIVSNGTLRVDGSIVGSATVKSGATLGGSGVIGGLVTVEPGGALGAGASIGILSLNTSPLLNGSVVAEVDRNGGFPLADLIAVLGNPITYSGTLVVTNAGAPLEVGDTFTLFNASSYSGSFTLISKTPGQIVTWNTSNLTVDGTISVATVQAVAPPVINTSLNGNTLSISWPAENLGWTLETNSVSVADANSWFPLPGSGSVTNVNITINPALPNVFFRLVEP